MLHCAEAFVFPGGLLVQRTHTNGSLGRSPFGAHTKHSSPQKSKTGLEKKGGIVVWVGINR
jgi:hypothetical protein